VQVCGHSRAVSYVRWLGADRLVSASTDNCLKLWDVAAASRAGAAPAPLTTFTGARPAPGSPGQPYPNPRLEVPCTRALVVPCCAACGRMPSSLPATFCSLCALVSTAEKAAATRAGHVNERNFVGLSVTADGYLACGSEDNAVYAYSAGLPAPLAHHRFASADASLGAVRAPRLSLRHLGKCCLRGTICLSI